ncbi:MAG: DAK2 domain-containing protein, partial [Chloroflexota bacterium]|nr:DAK2 domain-containing protein [Chloroflexota bacterium]
RAEIDDLNVFPVPDGDTGTNLYITLDSALEAAREPRESVQGSGTGAGSTMAGDAAALARATLLAARGNSGVILSQLVRGLSEVIGEASTAGVVNEGSVGGNGHMDDTGDPDGGKGGIDGPTLALAVRRASDLAYASVTRPVEGTILTVASAAASAAELAAATGSDLYGVAHASLAAARVALAGTTAQLPILASAGVVDAGGMGYVLVLEALERVIAGELATDPRPELEERIHPKALHPVSLRAAAHAGGDIGPLEPGGPAYEVMYLLSDSSEDAVSRLRVRLDGLGDSVLVVGGEDIWNVHVHVDDVGAAIQAGIEAGRPHRIVVTHFGDQRRARELPTAPSDQDAVAVLACAAGEGLGEVFRAAGAAVVFNGPGRRASAGQLLDAIRSAGSRCVLVLPNETDTQLAAEAAASAAGDAGIEVHVVRSRSAAQGIAALAVFDPTASAEDNLIAMSGAAAATRPGAVTVATKEARTGAGWCQPGDVLGVVGGDVVAIGKDLVVVGADVVARLLADGGEMLTVINGAGGGPDLSAVVAASARDGRRDLEVSIIDGGQATYPLLLGVE